MLKHKIRSIFDTAIDVVFALILLFLVFGIAIGAIQLFSGVFNLLKLEGITGNYIGIITDVLTLYILVELSRSLVEYFYSHRFRLTHIVDAAIVFVLRDILIGLFRHNMEPNMIYALSALLLVLGALRIGSIIVQQREKATTDNETGSEG